MEIKQGTIAFPAIFGSGPQIVEQVLNYDAPTGSIIVLISGFNAQYGEDAYNFHDLEIDVKAKKISPYAIEISGTLGLRTSGGGGSYDNKYFGSIRYAILTIPSIEGFLSGTFDFPTRRSVTPPEQESVRFPIAIQQGVGVLTGFRAKFAEGGEFDFSYLIVDLDTRQPTPNDLSISGTLGVRDVGDFDDPFDGYINYAALGSPLNSKSGLFIRTNRLDFDIAQNTGEPIQRTDKITFPYPIGNCVAVLTGFTLEYEGEDKAVHQYIVEVEARKLSQTEIEVIGTIGLRDNDQQFMAPFEGSLRYAVLAYRFNTQASNQ